jgi:hypothetical protein
LRFFPSKCVSLKLDISDRRRTWYCYDSCSSIVFCKLQKRCTRLPAANDKVYQLLAHGRWFSPVSPASSTAKTGRHDIAEILLKVALNTNNQIKSNRLCFWYYVHCFCFIYPDWWYRSGEVIISVLSMSAADREFVPRSDKTKDYQIIICCCAKHAAILSKSRYFLGSEWE